MPSIITANDLRSGLVVYLGPEARWVRDLADAAIAANSGDLEALETQALDAVVRTEVTAVYAMKVRVTDSGPAPVSVREWIRAAHVPSV
ncbi:MAG: DUF2849 domain-containing protein [Hyphomicrobiaceae bacterium]